MFKIVPLLRKLLDRILHEDIMLGILTVVCYVIYRESLSMYKILKSKKLCHVKTQFNEVNIMFIAIT